MIKSANAFLLLILLVTGANAADFVKIAGTSFTVDGKPFFITGANNHYLTSGTNDEVTRVLDDAVELGANVVRTFLQPVIGSLDGSVSTIWDWKTDPEIDGTYLLYWDTPRGKMVINDGPDGMQRVDFLITEAKKRNLRLIIAFVDFWVYTGGIQQMRSWYQSPDKDEFFFIDPRTKRDYKNWVSHVIERVNPNTGLRYRDDPTIMAWELANEPVASPEQLRHAWVSEMSEYVKAEDKNHLVASGHANGNIDQLDILIPTIDFETWHGYPRYLKMSVTQMTNRITQFCGIAALYHKPVLLEEFGYARSHPDQAEAYTEWLKTLAVNHDCAGWLVWRLVSLHKNGYYLPDDYDQFDIRNDGSRIWDVLWRAIRAGRF